MSLIISPSGGSSLTLSDDTSTNATHYPLCSTTATPGALTAIDVSSSKLTFNPSTGNLSSTLFSSLSDKNFKENIFKINNSLDIIENIRGVSFNWKSDKVKTFGIIAQELEKVLPELVLTHNKIKTINYSGLIPFLIEAIKELNNKIKVLEDKINVSI